MVQVNRSQFISQGKCFSAFERILCPIKPQGEPYW